MSGDGGGQDSIVATAMADISANVFSVFLIIWLILLAAGSSAPVSGPVDLAGDNRLVERAPLRGAELIALLRQNGGNQAGVTIDLLARSARISGNFSGSPVEIELSGFPEAAVRIQGALRGLDHAVPVRLYIFSADAYAHVLAALRAGGWSWQEMNVPVALRARDDGPPRWSAAFLDLQRLRLDEPAYRRELSRLLAAGETSARAAAWGESSLQGAPQPLSARFWRFGLVFTHLAALAVGFIAIFWIERQGRTPLSTLQTRPSRPEF